MWFLDVKGAHYRNGFGREIVVQAVVEKADDLVAVERQHDDMQAVIEDLLGPLPVALFVRHDAAGMVVRLRPVLRPQRHNPVTISRRGDTEAIAGERGAIDALVFSLIWLK